MRRYFSVLISVYTITEILKAANDSKDFTLWPYESMPACIVHNSNGSTYVIHPNSDPRQQPQKRQSFEILSALVGRVAHQTPGTILSRRHNEVNDHRFGHGPFNVLDLKLLSQCQPFSARGLCLNTKSP